MVLVTRSWRLYLVGLAVSLVMFAVIYFAVISPAQNTANQALKTGLQQSQQVINQAQKQLSNSSSGQASGVTQQALGNAAKLTACVSSAGTDTGKLQACQVKYGH
jgi:ABC-type dipeptide/oligopeptide/nickel transport system permease component